MHYDRYVPPCPTGTAATSFRRPALVLPVAVIGGGITGLTAAWELQRAGHKVTILENGPRLGGAIGTHREEGWLHELGPNSLLDRSGELSAFVEALGLGGRRLDASYEARRRYVVRGGALRAMPASPLGFVSTRLFSWRAKAGLLREPWRPRVGNDEEESVASFVRRRLGQEFLDYAVNPFVGGVYAGDPEALSVEHGFPRLHALEREHGSLLRGAWKRRNPSGAPRGSIFSFTAGLQELTNAIVRPLEGAVRLHARITALRQRESSWEIEYWHNGAMRREFFSAVVCAVPAGALARLPFENLAVSGHLQLVSEIEHPPVASVFTGYRRCDVAHPLDGFGLLVPEVEHARILGTLFSSSMFAGRAPAGHVGLTTFVGGVRQPEWAQVDDEQLCRLVAQELTRLLGAGTPVYTHIRRWPRAIPQYTLGYGRYKEAIAAAEAAAPGLHIGGSLRDGISVGQCLAAGRRLAASVSSLQPLPSPGK